MQVVVAEHNLNCRVILLDLAHAVHGLERVLAAPDQIAGEEQAVAAAVVVDFVQEPLEGVIAAMYITNEIGSHLEWGIMSELVAEQRQELFQGGLAGALVCEIALRLEGGRESRMLGEGVAELAIGAVESGGDEFVELSGFVIAGKLCVAGGGLGGLNKGLV